jgi:hypothetical protein
MKDFIEDNLISSFESLIKEGTELALIAEGSEYPLRGEELIQVSSWLSQTKSLLMLLFPGGDIFSQQLSYIIEQSSQRGATFFTLHKTYYAHLNAAVGCLKGAYEAFKAGRLSNIRAILQADIFTDFLEMAEHLLKKKYKDAAAVLIGAVLEDTLRKLASNLGIPLQTNNGKRKTIEPLNDDLVKAGLYDTLIKKQVTTWADLRNKAAHGEFDKYDTKMVRMMLIFVQDFCTKYLR